MRSRIKGYDPKFLQEGVDENINHYAVKEIKSSIDLSSDEGLEFYEKFMGLNYSNRINKHGVVIHNINGIMFTSIENNVERHRFKMRDMSNDPEDFSKGKSFKSLSNNPLYIRTLKLSEAKAFESIEECNAFQFKLVQAVADQL